jgi:hypothetical protein
VVEHSLGKGEVTSSILVMGSTIQGLLQFIEKLIQRIARWQRESLSARSRT